MAALALLILLPCAGLSAAAAPAPQASARFELTLSTDSVKRTAGAEFSCRDKVYAFLRLPRRLAGEHSLEARWYRPDGRLQEKTQVPLRLAPPGQDSVHLWLQCHVPDAADAVDVFFPAHGGEEFDGRWRVEVFWNGRLARSASFTLACQ